MNNVEDTDAAKLEKDSKCDKIVENDEKSPKDTCAKTGEKSDEEELEHYELVFLKSSTFICFILYFLFSNQI